jgi:RNA ligase (TIGR02306 family)
VSHHEVRVIRIAEIVKHPNADSLGLVHYVVPDAEQFAFLQGNRRIKARRLRGTWSQGLLIHAPAGASEGECVMERLGIVRYEAPMQGHQRGPSGKPAFDGAEKPHKTLAWLPKYDLENWRKFHRVLQPGEPVSITEKIHGANARYAWRDGRMWCGSRQQWKLSGEPTRWQRILLALRTFVVAALPSVRRYWRAPPNMRTGNIWWRVLDTHGWIVEWCKSNPDCVLYGEVFGSVQDLRYGAADGELFFRAFDVMLPGGDWMHADMFADVLPAAYRVPQLYVGPYCPTKTEEMSRMKRSTLADHVAEGIVVKPLRERRDPKLGRVALKLVSDLYLERAS